MWFSKVTQVPRSTVLPHPTDALLDHFVLGKELGSGFSGVVRLCTDKVSGQSFACKSIKKANLEDEDDLEDVRLEIGVMRRLKEHENIVGLRNVFEDDDHVHLILELCAGGDLFDEIVNRGPFNEIGAAWVIAQMAAAVATCHSRGVMHRDLKPENILLVHHSGRVRDGIGGPGGSIKALTSDAESMQDDRCHVKLADFGLAMFLGPFQEASGFAGSPYYVAPEVLSQAFYGKEADIWSMGVVLYVMLSGEFPFAGKTDVKLYKAIKRGKLSFCHAPWPSISVRAKSLIRSMLSLDPRARPSAVEILQHPWVQTTCFATCPSNTASGKPIMKLPGSLPAPPHLASYLPPYATGLTPPRSALLKEEVSCESSSGSPMSCQSSSSSWAESSPDTSSSSVSTFQFPTLSSESSQASQKSTANSTGSSTSEPFTFSLPSNASPDSPQPLSPSALNSSSNSKQSMSSFEQKQHKKQFGDDVSEVTLTPKVLSSTSCSSASSSGSSLDRSPNAVLRGPSSTTGSETGTYSSPASPSGSTSSTPKASTPSTTSTTFKPRSTTSVSSVDEVLTACFTQVTVAAASYSAAVLGRCCNLRRRGGVQGVQEGDAATKGAANEGQKTGGPMEMSGRESLTGAAAGASDSGSRSNGEVRPDAQNGAAAGVREESTSREHQTAGRQPSDDMSPRSAPDISPLPPLTPTFCHVTARPDLAFPSNCVHSHLYKCAVPNTASVAAQ